MIQTVEAVIEPGGGIRWLEPLQITGPRRVLVTVLPPDLQTDEVTRMSEAALSDWNHPEEDEAWSSLQPRK